MFNVHVGDFSLKVGDDEWAVFTPLA